MLRIPPASRSCSAIFPRGFPLSGCSWGRSSQRCSWLFRSWCFSALSAQPVRVSQLEFDFGIVAEVVDCKSMCFFQRSRNSVVDNLLLMFEYQSQDSGSLNHYGYRVTKRQPYLRAILQDHMLPFSQVSSTIAGAILLQRKPLDTLYRKRQNPHRFVLIF